MQALNQTCLRASLLCVNTDSGRLRCHSMRIRTRQLTQDGCAGFLNQPNKRLTSTSLLHTASWKRKWQMGRGGDGLKQEMTSIPSATQLTAMIKKRERGDRQQQEIKFWVICQAQSIWYKTFLCVCKIQQTFLTDIYLKIFTKEIEWWRWARRDGYSLSFFPMCAVLAW